jgi:hypothetical protein
MSSGQSHVCLSRCRLNVHRKSEAVILTIDGLLLLDTKKWSLKSFRVGLLYLIPSFCV